MTDVFTCRDQTARDKQVLLTDHVATSGATLDFCAAALKSSGVAPVWALDGKGDLKINTVLS